MVGSFYWLDWFCWLKPFELFELFGLVTSQPASPPAEALADLLAEHAPGDLTRVYFVSGGSEANETAMKLARQYVLEIQRANLAQRIRLAGV